MNRAAIPIPEKLFFKIGEVCEITGIQAHVLRYWESEFPTLAPQKNRAGQRTYRKRDVEMVLRIKELLYEDQYTIAGAKKKLSGEMRGASKLKVVTPEMAAQAQTSTPQIVPPPSMPAEDEYEPTISYARSAFERSTELLDDEPEMTGEKREALRRLAEQMRELLSLLKSSEPQRGTPRK